MAETEVSNATLSEEAVKKLSGEEFPSGANEGVEDQDTATTNLHIDGEVVKSKKTLNEPNRSENGDIDGEIEEGSVFELGIEDSKDLLSLNEELSSILDPKVGQTTQFNVK